MRFDPPLVSGTLRRRYRRFLADVQLADGSSVTAHCPNSGAMTGMAEPGSRVLLSRSEAAHRRLPWTWELVQVGRTWVGVNSARANSLVAEALLRHRIPALAGYAVARREVPWGRTSRIDLLLDHPRRPDCYVEVKSVTLARDRVAQFPDAVTLRGQKHLRALMAVARQGLGAALVFWVFRGDCRVVRPADDVDPGYGRLLRRAAENGVAVLAIRAKVSPQAVSAGDCLPVEW